MLTQNVFSNIIDNVLIILEFENDNKNKQDLFQIFKC